MKDRNRKKVIIVGGGTAGLIIASRLQEKFDVLVIEKSSNKSCPLWYRIPLFIGLLFKKKNQYVSVWDLTMLNDRKVPFFESNLLGGSSVMNGCVHVVGSTKSWGRLLERFKLSQHDFLQSLKNNYSEGLVENNKITLRLAEKKVVDDLFIKSLNNKSINLGDMAFADKEECGSVINTVGRYFRSSVLSLLNDKVNIRMGSRVDKLLIDECGVVNGVVVDGKSIHGDYVILSAGVMGTNEILLQEKSSSHRFLVDSHVATGVKDHTNLRVNVRTKERIGSLNEISCSFLKQLSMVLKHFSGKPSLMRGTGATSAAHLDLDLDGEVDTRIQIVHFSESGRAGSEGKLFNSCSPGFSISITCINPSSEGSISLSNEGVSVDPGYLSLQKDLEHLKKALNFCMELLKSEPLGNSVLEIEDEDVIVNDPDQYIRTNVYSGYHLIGGVHQVVDEDFKVKGLDGLYVCDASVLSEYPASNIHAPVVLLADMFANRFFSEK